MESPHWIPVVHRIEGRDFIDSHGGHIKSSCNLIHDTYACEAVLPLAEVEQGHYGSLLVLWRVTFKDLRDELLADGIELERDRWVVPWGIAMLCCFS